MSLVFGYAPHPLQPTAAAAGCDHGLNASTFTARVIVSTRSDIISAITGAVGALKGPLHGGAPGPALYMVLEIGEADRAEAVILAKLERGERLMGFGHRVYRVRDPRADVLAAAAEQTINLCKGNTRYLPRQGIPATCLAEAFVISRSGCDFTKVAATEQKRMRLK